MKPDLNNHLFALHLRPTSPTDLISLVTALKCKVHSVDRGIVTPIQTTYSLTGR